MKKFLRLIMMLLVGIATSSYGMYPDKSGFDAGMGIGLSAPIVSIPGLGTQQAEQRAEHESRQLTRFEQAIVKKAVEKLENIFKEQAREEEVNLLKLPFELQVQILDRLSLAKLGRLARVSRTYRDLVNKYRNQVTILDLSNESNITPKFLRALSKLYHNVKKIIIYNPKIKTVVTVDLIKSLTENFPELEYIKLLDHTYMYEDRSPEIIELYLWKHLIPDWIDQSLNRMVEYTQMNLAGDLFCILKI